MLWHNITTQEDLKQALSQSMEEPVVFFKHSTRCSISLFVKKSFEQACSSLSSKHSFYLLNVITNRAESNALAEHFQIKHESPQVIATLNNKVFYTNSHDGIDGSELVNQLKTI